MFAVIGISHEGKREGQSFTSGPKVGQHKAGCPDSRSIRKEHSKAHTHSEWGFSVPHSLNLEFE